MRITTKVLSGGCACAIVIVAGGLVYADRVKDRRDALIAECRTKPNPFDQFDDAPITIDDALAYRPRFAPEKPVCDPYELISLGANEGLQGQIVDAHYAALAANDASWFWAGVVAVLSAIPWAWYFLLRRISELRSAFAGNPPEH